MDEAKGTDPSTERRLDAADAADAAADNYGVSAGGGPSSREPRLRMLIAASDLFADYGFRGVTYSAIAAASGLPKGSLTNYFPTKAALADAILADMRRRCDQLVARADVRQSTDPLAAMLAEVADAAAAVSTDPVLRAGVRLVADPDVSVDVGDPLSDVVEHRVLGYLRRARDQGLLRPDVAPETLARLIVALLVGHRETSARTPAGPQLRDRLSESLALLLPAVVTPAGASATQAARHHHPDAGLPDRGTSS